MLLNFFKIFKVRATDKTFAETREKAQKLVEEQQKRKIKDMTNSKVHKRIQDVRTASNPPAALAKRIGLNSANSTLSSSQKFKQAVSIKVFYFYLITINLIFFSLLMHCHQMCYQE